MIWCYESAIDCQCSENLTKEAGFFSGGSPAGSKADDGVGFVVFFPEAVRYFFGQRIQQLVGKDDKNLVGWCIKKTADIRFS